MSISSIWLRSTRALAAISCWMLTNASRLTARMTAKAAPSAAFWRCSEGASMRGASSMDPSGPCEGGARPLGKRVEDGQQLGSAERLLHELRDAGPEGQQRQIASAGHHPPRNFDRALRQHPRHCEAIRLGHVDVEQHGPAVERVRGVD